jgi:hypothetical protein
VNPALAAAEQKPETVERAEVLEPLQQLEQVEPLLELAARQTERAAEQARRAAERAAEQADRARERERGARDRLDSLYEQGQNSIEREQWARAIEQFSAIVAAKAQRADAAMYWRAYSQDKLNRQAEALASVQELIKTYPSSRWLGDARALEIQVRQRAGQPVSPEAQADEDLKLLAIQGLQHSDPERAIPMLEKLLQSSQSPRVKERALFVLAQSNSPQARQILTGIAKGGGNPDLQLHAIRYLGMARSQANSQLLSDIYSASNDVDIKRQILRAFMMSGDRARVLAAATSEKTPALRAEAIRQLGMMGAQDEVWQLYQKETDPDVKSQIVQSVFMSGNSARLIEIATNEPNMELRRRAIQHLGMMGSQRTSDTLNTLYAKQTSVEVKEAIIDALFIQQNAESLVALARKESDRNLKRRMVEKLALMKSPAARDYMLELLK